jgi:hypothetical protein
VSGPRLFSVVVVAVGVHSRHSPPLSLTLTSLTHLPTHSLTHTPTDVKEHLAVHSTAAAGAKGKGKAAKKKGVTLPLEMFQDVGFKVSVCGCFSGEGEGLMGSCCYSSCGYWFIVRGVETDAV